MRERNEQRNVTDAPKEKKKYRRPEILYREPLEAMAALCGPSPPAKANPVPPCTAGTKS